METCDRVEFTMKGGKDFQRKRGCFVSDSNIHSKENVFRKILEYPSHMEWCLLDEVIYNEK